MLFFLPELGGKILSFYRKDKDFELAAQKGRGDGLILSGAERFSDYAFGMDDAFPNIDAEEILWNDRRLRYPDHGEIWNHAFQVQEQGELFAKLSWRSEAFSYLYEKSFSLEGEKLRIRYRICNPGREEIPCIWTWHGLMRYDAAKLPYLGGWITAGDFQGDYNCALEPSSGFYDKVSRARTLKTLPVLGSGEETEFELALSLEEL